ncbi:MAG: hypothetical protein ABUL73_04525 [Alphaproteobacteria bacterium]
MQGPIAQALALVCVGNTYLRGRDVSGFWPDASVFRFTKHCEFGADDASQPIGYRALAPDPAAWFASLKPECSGLRLHAAPALLKSGQMPGVNERMLVGFVGGGPRWLIEAVGAQRSQIWQGFDRVLDRNDPERKIWGTVYILQGETEPQSAADVSLLSVTQALDVALTEIESFAAEVAPDWRNVFASAREILGGAKPRDGFHADIGGYADLDAPSRGLLAAIEQGWVFGGMGSWNDMALNDERYEPLSENLFRALIDAITTLANTTYPRRPG